MTSCAQQIQGLLAAAESLIRAGVLSPTGHISVSARAENRMVLGTEGLAHQLSPDTFVQMPIGVTPAGPGAEIPLCDLHMAVYEHRPDANAVLHTHSPYATALALAHVSLPAHYEPLLRYEQSVPVPVAPWEPRGSPTFSRSVLTTLERHARTRAVLLANHGLLVVGPTPRVAAKLLITIEEAAAAEIRAACLGGSRPMDHGDPRQLARDHPSVEEGADVVRSGPAATRRPRASRSGPTR